MKTRLVYCLMALLTVYACSSDGGDDGTSGSGSNSGGSNSGGNNTNAWSIPVDKVIDGGPGRDGIPSIDNPIFYDGNDARVDTYMQPVDLVIGVIRDGEVRAYPHRILDWHEIVNDEINGEKFTINYCPLTGSAFSWESKVGGVETTFGVSGLLYNTNLILYDRLTESNWSQLTLECVNGQSLGDIPRTQQIFETNWVTWKTMYPNTKILANEQNLNRNYDNYPYGPYRTNHDFFLFPLDPLNPALPNKQRVHAVLAGNQSKAYTFDKFTGGKAVKDGFGGKNILVVGNEYMLNSFELNSAQNNLTFSFGSASSGEYFTDNEGNKWLITGEAIEGPRTGQKLTPTKSFNSFWFALALFYPNPIIYQ